MSLILDQNPSENFSSDVKHEEEARRGINSLYLPFTSDHGLIDVHCLDNGSIIS